MQAIHSDHILGPNGTVTGGGSGRKPNFNRVYMLSFKLVTRRT